MRARKVEISESCQIFHKKGLTSPFLWLPKSPLSYLIFIMSTFDDMHSETKWEQWVAASAIAVTAQTSNLFLWHVDNMEGYPTLHQMALDTLSIPAMSTECERVFSSTKKLVTPHRCSIKEDLMEATECLKA
jgi:hypothetical protein